MNLLVCSFLAFLGLRCRTQAFSSCSEPWLLLLQSTTSRALRLQQLQHVGSVVAELGLQNTQASVVVAPGLAAPWQVGSSQTRDPIHVLRIGMRTPNLWTPGEVLKMNFLRPYRLMTCLEFDLKYLKKKGEREEER